MKILLLLIFLFIVGCGDNFKYSIENDRITIIEKDGKPAINIDTKGELIIPSKISGKTVVSIGNNAFANCAKITSVIIPDGVESIGEYAFSGCSSLTLVRIPDSVKSIGKSAFKGCLSLNSIRIPYNVKSLSMSAFNFPTDITPVAYFCIMKARLYELSVTIPLSRAMKDFIIDDNSITPNDILLLEELLYKPCSDNVDIADTPELREVMSKVYKMDDKDDNQVKFFLTWINDRPKRAFSQWLIFLNKVGLTWETFKDKRGDNMNDGAMMMLGGLIPLWEKQFNKKRPPSVIPMGYPAFRDYNLSN